MHLCDSWHQRREKVSLAWHCLSDQILTFTIQMLCGLRLRPFIKIAPENPVLWTGMKGASVGDRKNVVYETL